MINKTILILTTEADFMNKRQMVDELAIDFEERLEKAQRCCLVQLLEVECVGMAAGNM